MTATENGDVLFLPCAANLSKLRFNNTFYEDVGQEQTEFENWHIKNEAKNTFKISHSVNDGRKLRSSIRFDTLNNILHYNEYRFMDSIHAIKLPYIIEECEECNEIALCNKWKKNGEWKNSIISQLPVEFIPKEDLIKINSTFFDKGFFKQWEGAYHFNYHIIRMDYEFKGIVKFHIKDSSYVLYDEDKKTLKVLSITKDTLNLEDQAGDIYKIYKDKQGDFNVSGHPIYMLNPPNESYLLTKEK